MRGTHGRAWIYAGWYEAGQRTMQTRVWEVLELLDTLVWLRCGWLVDSHR